MRKLSEAQAAALADISSYGDTKARKQTVLSLENAGLIAWGFPLQLAKDAKWTVTEAGKAAYLAASGQDLPESLGDDIPSDEVPESEALADEMMDRWVVKPNRADRRQAKRAKVAEARRTMRLRRTPTRRTVRRNTVSQAVKLGDRLVVGEDLCTVISDKATAFGSGPKDIVAVHVQHPDRSESQVTLSWGQKLQVV